MIEFHGDTEYSPIYRANTICIHALMLWEYLKFKITSSDSESPDHVAPIVEATAKMKGTDSMRYYDETEFINRMAEICFLAQEHFNDRSQWPDGDFDFAFEPISFVVSCYFSHNTNYGNAGVDWEIVHNELCESNKKKGEWVFIIERKIKDYSGFRRHGD